MIYLIDFENVHEDGFHSIGHLGDKDAVYCFFTKNVAKISMSALAGMRNGQLHFVEADSGKQSLDLALVSFLGYLIGTRPQELYYDIVSNDNGFQKAADFWNKRGMNLRVRVRKTNPDNKPRTELVRPQNTAPAIPTQESLQTQETVAAQNSPQTQNQASTRGRNRNSGRQGRIRNGRTMPEMQVRVRTEEDLQKETDEVPTAAEETAAASEVIKPVSEDVDKTLPAADIDSESASSETPAESSAADESEAVAAVSKEKAESRREPAKTAKDSDEMIEVDSMSVSGLESAGIPADAAEFLLAQAEKYREEKNIRQMVYRAVVKKYGQKKGTQIYNTAKKVVLR